MNLRGSKGASCCLMCKIYFKFLQALFVFFAATPFRWEILMSFLTNKNTLKSLRTTRWSAREDSATVVHSEWVPIAKALKSLLDDPEQNSKTRATAEKLLKKLHSPKLIFMSCFWSDILQRFNAVSVQLQSVEMDVATVIELYSSLCLFF